MHTLRWRWELAQVMQPCDHSVHSQGFATGAVLCTPFILDTLIDHVPESDCTVLCWYCAVYPVLYPTTPVPVHFRL